MTKQITIYKCEECPYAEHDEQTVEKHWGKWVCTYNAAEASEYKLLEQENVLWRHPLWCELDDYC